MHQVNCVDLISNAETRLSLSERLYAGIQVWEPWPWKISVPIACGWNDKPHMIQAAVAATWLKWTMGIFPSCGARHKAYPCPCTCQGIRSSSPDTGTVAFPDTEVVVFLSWPDRLFVIIKESVAFHWPSHFPSTPRPTQMCRELHGLWHDGRIFDGPQYPLLLP